MNAIDPTAPDECPRRQRVTIQYDGREYPLVLDRNEWRLRSRASTHPADYRTGTHSLMLAKQKAKAWLETNPDVQLRSRKGGGSLEAVVKVYETAPKRTKLNAAKGNISRLRTICRKVFGRELEAITCREFTADVWRKYQQIALKDAGKAFDLVTRHRENLCINTAVRMARCVFLDPLIRVYRAEGLDVAPDCAKVVPLPVPKVPVVHADDGQVLCDWADLLTIDGALWLTIGLARFAGLRRSEIMACRGTWIERANDAVFVVMHDRPAESFWIKGAGVYRAQVIEPDLARVLASKIGNPDYVVPLPANIERFGWFADVPQEWLKARGITDRKPLHHLRKLYAKEVQQLTADAVSAQLKGRTAAQRALGHANISTTDKHYL
jgi:integrase